MTTNQIIILGIMIAYLVFNVVVGMWMANRQEKASTMSKEKKYFIGSRGMNGLVLAMTTMATYTSVSSFISGPGAAGMTYGYAQVWVAAVQFGTVFLVMGILGNRLAIVSRRTGAVTIAGYLKARYKSDGLVIVTSLLMVAFFIAQMISQFTGGATLVESVTGLPYWASLAIFSVVVIVYTSFGGFTAVVITDTILNRVTLNWKRGKRTHVFLDEFHVVFENEQSGVFFNSAWRQFRKRGAYPTAITQNVEYLLDSVQASTMLSNSEFIVMLNQAASDREKLAKLLNISKEQMSYVTNADAGCGLIRYGSALVPFINRFPRDTKLYELMTTKPGEGVFGGEKEAI